MTHSAAEDFSGTKGGVRRFHHLPVKPNQASALERLEGAQDRNPIYTAWVAF
jgi:hypothetical protein